MGSLYFSLHEATLSVCGCHLLFSGCFTLVIFWLLDFFPKVMFGVFYGCFCLLVQLLKSRHQDSIMNFINHLGTVYVLYWGKEGAVLRRKVWDQPALPGAQDGETRHPVAVDAAVAGQMCPPLLCSADTRFTWPGMGEDWALSTYIYHWLHPCIWFSSWLTHVSNCFCTQGISKLKILISSLITSKAITCLFYFFKKFILSLFNICVWSLLLLGRTLFPCTNTQSGAKRSEVGANTFLFGLQFEVMKIINRVWEVLPRVLVTAWKEDEKGRCDALEKILSPFLKFTELIELTSGFTKVFYTSVLSFLPILNEDVWSVTYIVPQL